MQQLTVSEFPQFVLLDVADIFFALRAEVSMTTRGAEVDWDAFFDQLFERLIFVERRLSNYINTPAPPESPWSDHYELRQLVEQMAYGDILFEKHQFEDRMRARLYSVILSAALHIKERMMQFGAYHNGVFPYSYRTMISDGCLYFSKNESIYDSPVSDSGY